MPNVERVLGKRRGADLVLNGEPGSSA